MANRRLVVTTTALSILMSLSLSTASRADGNPQTYLNDPLFVELAADMAYTSSLISDESKQLSISVDQMMYDSNGVPTLMVTQSLSISANNVAGTATINGWDVSSSLTRGTFLNSDVARLPYSVFVLFVLI